MLKDAGSRVIYRVLGGQVVICLIGDGRRYMQSVLARRLLSACPLIRNEIRMDVVHFGQTQLASR